MKKHSSVLALGIMVITLGTAGSLIGCSSAPKVSRVSADTQVDLSGNWNDTDVRKVCDTLIKEALEAPRIDSYIRDFAGSHGGELPTVIVGRFKNTSSEHIDTGIISSLMRAAIINSGKLEFVEGGDAREELRAERNDQQGNASEATAAALANEAGANFMLQGEVSSIVDRAGNTTVRSYFVKATLTNVETNRILWEGQNNDIKKVIQQPRAKF
ncbi:penicillin-binding protein activator LpoB [Spirochaetia bacterium]|nr:penicillin-binding protein activator LpoB [Spirochaetia bacterium]